jgi:hypothetical protein
MLYSILVTLKAETQYQTPTLLIDNATFAEDGLMLAGVNHEIRAMALGALLLRGDVMTVQNIHDTLKENDYNELHEMWPVHIRNLFRGMPDQLLDKERLVDDGTVELTQLGIRAASLGGLILGSSFELPDGGLSLHSLVGGYKNMTNPTGQPPSPSVRRSIYEFLTTHPDGVSVGDMKRALLPTGATEKGIRKHLSVLEQNGIIVNDGPPGGVRRIEGSSVQTIQDYLDTVTRFSESPTAIDDGVAFFEQLFDSSSDHNFRIPSLTKRAMQTSGKSTPNLLLEINDQVRDVFRHQGAGAELTTTEIAEHLGIDVNRVTTYLNRMYINLNDKSAVNLLPGRAPGNERVWVLRSISLR